MAYVDYIEEDALTEEEDYDEVSAEDYREWSLANVGLTEADLPYSMRTVSNI